MARHVPPDSPDVLQKHISRNKTVPLNWKEMAASLLEKQPDWQ